MNNSGTLRILIANGVNLGQLGTREVNIYGHLSFDEYLADLREAYPNLHIDYIQEDDETRLAHHIAQATGYHGIVLNA